MKLKHRNRLWTNRICQVYIFFYFYQIIKYSVLTRLPGRSLAENQTTWVCNANYADSKVFNRTLLAKVYISFDPGPHLYNAYVLEMS